MGQTDKPPTQMTVPAEPLENLIKKRRGEVAELAFMHKATSLGFGVSKPWGDTERYDFIVSWQHYLWRVQVKSLWIRKPAYRLMACGFKDRPYTVEQVDFLVAYIGPEELWYVMPITLVGSRILYLAPRSRKSQYVRFIEAWGLFRGEQPAMPKFPIPRRTRRMPSAAPIRDVVTSEDRIGPIT